MRGKGQDDSQVSDMRDWVDGGIIPHIERVVLEKDEFGIKDAWSEVGFPTGNSPKLTETIDLERDQCKNQG